jgi:hypothetical protein
MGKVVKISQYGCGLGWQGFVSWCFCIKNKSKNRRFNQVMHRGCGIIQPLMSAP